MQLAFDKAFLCARARGFPVWRLMLSLLLFGSELSLTGCRYLNAAAPAAALTATPVPRQDPIPTVEVLDSETLYGQDSRSIGQTNPSLASFPAGAILPPVPDGKSERGVIVLLDADKAVGGELFQPDGLRQPGILLLGADVSGWETLPARLSQNGFVVLVLAAGPSTQARHVETMLASLIAIPRVDAGSIGVIGVGYAADIAALACTVNTLCDTVALLSPRSRDTLLNMLPSYGDRPIWLAAGSDDLEAMDTASTLAEAASGEAEFSEVSAGRGVQLLKLQPDLVDKLIAWMQRHLRAQ